MKGLIFSVLLIITMVIGSCDSRRDQLDEKEDKGIKPQGKIEKAVGDTTVSDELNPTGKAQSGPDEGP